MTHSLLDDKQSEMEQSHGAVGSLMDESRGTNSTTKPSTTDRRSASEHTDYVVKGIGQNETGQWLWSRDTGPVQSAGGQWSYRGDTSRE